MALPQTSNPFSTGAGGTTFEYLVGVFYLVSLLAKDIPRGLDRGITTSVRFQQRYTGAIFDDVIVESENAEHKRFRLALQVKHHLIIGDNEAFRQVLSDAWATFTNEGGWQFVQEFDRLGIILGEYDKDVCLHLQPILDCARSTSSAEEFFDKLSVINFSEKKRKYVFEIFKPLLLRIKSDLTNEELFQFLRHLVVLHFDVEHAGAGDSLFLWNRLLDQLMKRDDVQAKNIARSLFSLVAEYSKNAAGFTRETLLQQLSGFDWASANKGEDRYSEYSTLQNNYLYSFESEFTGTENLAGRQPVFDALDMFLGSKESGYFCIQADAGLGKTALAVAITKKYHALHFFANVQQNLTQAATCLKHLCASLIIRFQLPYHDLPDRAGETPDFLNNLLKQAAKQTRISVQQHKPLCIVIDACDEFDISDPRRPILPLPLQLPPNVFIVLTYRPGTKPFSSAAVAVQEYTIEASNDQQLAAIESFLYKRATDPQVSQALKRMTPPVCTDDFIALLKTASEGNFMYLKYVIADTIEQSEIGNFLNIHTFPKGLQAYYEQLWTQMQVVANESGREYWERVYRPVIILLVTAGEPVDIQWLADHTGREPDEIRLALRRWQRFLRSRASDKSRTWSLVHQSFADFLEHHEFLPRHHKAIATYYLMHPERWHAHASYACRHLSMHLRFAHWYDKLFELVDNKAWKLAQLLADASGAYYLNDVTHAWTIAETINADAFAEHQQLPLLGREIRCALAAAELRSVTKNISPLLLKEFVRKGIWTYAQALRIVRHIPDLESASTAFVSVTSCMQQGNVSSREELEIAFSFPETGSEKSCPRGEALVALASHLPSDQLTEALNVTFQIRYVRGRYETLIGLIPYLSYNDLVRTREIAHSLERYNRRTKRVIAPLDTAHEASIPQREQSTIPYDPLDKLDDYEEEMLVALSSRLAKLGHAQEAVTMIREIKRDYYRAKTLKELSGCLPECWMHELLDLTQYMTSEHHKGEVLVELVKYVPQELLFEVLTITKKFSTQKRPDRRSQILASLIPRLPADILLHEEKLIEERADSGYSEEASIAFVSRLSNLGYFDEALLLARSLKDSCTKARALRELDTGKLDLRREELEAILLSSNRWAAASVLERLAGRWSPALLHEALHRVLIIENEIDRTELLEALAPWIQDTLVSEVLAAMHDMSEYCQLRILVKLLPRIREKTERQTILHQLLREKKNYVIPFDWPAKLVELANHVADDERIVISAALEAIDAKEDPYYRPQEFERIAHMLPAHFLSEALDVASSIPYHWPRERAVTALVPYLSSNLLLKALEIVKEIDDVESQSDVQVKLALALVEKHFFQDALQVISSIKSAEHRQKAVVTVTHKMPTFIQQSLLPIAMTLDSLKEQADAFFALIPVLREDLLQVVLVAVPTLKETYQQLIVARELSKYLSLPLLVEAAHHWNTISDPLTRFNSLMELVPRLPKGERQSVLHKALLAARSADLNSFPAAPVYKALALRTVFPYFSTPEQLIILQDVREATYAIDLPEYQSVAWVKLVKLAAKIESTSIMEEAKSILFSMNEEQKLWVCIQLSQDESLPRPERDRMFQQGVEIAETSEDHLLDIDELAPILHFLSHAKQLALVERAISQDRMSKYNNTLQNLMTIAKYLSEEIRVIVQQKLLQRVQECTKLEQRVHDSIIILPLLPELQRKSLLRNIWEKLDFDNKNDHDIVKKLLACLSPLEQQMTLQAGRDAAYKCTNGCIRANALITIAMLLSEGEMEKVLPDIIQAISEITEELDRVQTIRTVMPLLQTMQSRPLIHKVVSLLEAMTQNMERWEILIALSNCESSENRQRILQLILEETKDMSVEKRFQLFLSVIDQIPIEEHISMLSQMIDNALLLERNRYENLDTFADIGYFMRDREQPSTQALVKIISYIPVQLIEKVLLIAREVGNSYDQAVIMKHLTLRIQEIDADKIYIICNETLHVFASRTRKELLEYIESIVPTIFTLGSLDCMKELSTTIAELA